MAYWICFNLYSIKLKYTNLPCKNYFYVISLFNNKLYERNIVRRIKVNNQCQQLSEMRILINFTLLCSYNS